ncbi:MAG: hypothetical protein ACYSPI_11580, partial [Planctomycetota bacterium]
MFGRQASTNGTQATHARNDRFSGGWITDSSTAEANINPRVTRLSFKKATIRPGNLTHAPGNRPMKLSSLFVVFCSIPENLSALPVSV